MELCRPGSVHDLLISFPPPGPPLSLVVTILRQAIAGLRHLHRHRVIHRDFRSDNLLVASLEPVVVKVTDFGLSHRMSGDVDEAAKSYLRDGVGPTRWLAPEVLIRREHGTLVTTASDVYMFGGLMFEVRLPVRYTCPSLLV
jgi:serine/threonine protein kinase